MPGKVVIEREILFRDHKRMCGQGIQYVTSQKQSPSAIDYLGSMKEAVAIEKRLASVGSSKALKDVLGRCVSEYNKMVTKKAHRVTTEIKNLILNLFPSFNIRITNCFVFIFVDPNLFFMSSALWVGTYSEH